MAEFTPKEKAKELVDKFEGKKYALICVNEILQTNPTIKGNSEDLITMIVQTKAYYQLVIDEINSMK